MSYWQELPGKIDTTLIRLAGGIHTGVPSIDVPDDKALALLNLDTHSYPALSTRPGRAAKGTTLGTKPTGLFVVGDTLYASFERKLVKWSGTDWDLEHPLKEDLANIQSVEAVKFMDLGIFTDQSNWYKIALGTGAISLLGGSPPDGKYVTVHANRVYIAGLTAHTSGMAHSALRQPEDWTTADDAGMKYLDTPDSEIISGLTTAFDHVICFKPHWMFELYGTGPINYQFVQGPPGVGCVSHRSIVLLNGALYWLGDRKIFSYKGGSAPEDISFPVMSYMNQLNQDHWGQACAGTDGVRYILSIPTGSSIFPNVTLSFDPRVNAWHVWQIGNPVVMLRYGEDLLIGDVDGQIARMNSSISDDFGESITWSRTSKVFTSEPNVRQQSLRKLAVVAEIDEGSTLNTYVSGNADGEDSWVQVSSLTSPKALNRTRIQIPARAVADRDFVRIKLAGSGKVKLHRLERSIRVKEV